MDRCKNCSLKFKWLQIFKMLESLWFSQVKCRKCSTIYRIKLLPLIMAGITIPAIIIVLGKLLLFTISINVIILIGSAIASFLLVPYVARLKLSDNQNLN